MLAVENRHTYAYTARPLPIANWEKDMETFEYNSDLTYQENFERWSRMNRDEKSDYNETPYTKEQGAAVL